VNLTNRSLFGSVDLPARNYQRLKLLFSGGGALTTELETIVVGRVGFHLPAYGSVVAKRTPALTK
jgi:hypothetical protein